MREVEDCVPCFIVSCVTLLVKALTKVTYILPILSCMQLQYYSRPIRKDIVKPKNVVLFTVLNCLLDIRALENIKLEQKFVILLRIGKNK